MKKLGILALLIALTGCAAPNVQLTRGGSASYNAFSTLPTVSIPVKSKAQVNQLARMGIDILEVKPTFVVAMVSPQIEKRLKEKGFTTSPIAVGTRQRNAFDRGYHTYQSMTEELKALAAKYPAICQLQDIGDSWEKTKNQADRDLWALKITQGGGKKPAILFDAGTHAREIATPELAFRLATYLLEGYGKDPQVTKWVDTREIWIVPMANPDGHARAEKGANWRKNTNNTYGATSTYAPYGIGVDLNRNFGFQWGTAASDDPQDPTFQGPSPFSEPESQAIREFFKQQQIKVSLFLHSFSNLVLFPWGYTTDPTKDHDRFAAVAEKVASFSGYDPMPESQLYINSGGSDDWAYGEMGAFSMTIEVGSRSDGFDPPFKTVDRFWKENLPGFQLLLNIAHDPWKASF